MPLWLVAQICSIWHMEVIKKRPGLPVLVKAFKVCKIAKFVLIYDLRRAV